MGELFEKASPVVPLTWTGERLTAGAGRQVEIEHLHRYFFARHLCRDLDVLDVASGEGYGSALLAQTARSVVGVELDAQTVAHAQAGYIRPNLRFLEGDARSLPLPDACVDMVVSFETIEHFYDHDGFLAEVQRVLRPGGRFLASSPERDVYSPASSAANPYHVRELTRTEFLALLRRNFAHVAMQGQRTLLGSALVTETSHTPCAKGPTLTFERRGPDRFEASEDLPRPVYLVTIASDTPIGTMPDSLYIETSAVEEVLVDVPALRAEAREAVKSLAEAAGYAQHLEAELAARDRALTDAAGTVETAQAAHDLLAAKLTETERAFETAAGERAVLALKLADTERAAKAAAGERDVLAVKLADTERVARMAAGKRDALAAKLADAAADAQRVGARVRHLEDAVAACAKKENYAHGVAAELARVANENLALRAQLDQVVYSSIWRMSRPFRAALGGHPRVRRTLRRAAKLAWWTATLQLPRRIAARRNGPPDQKSLPDAQVESLRGPSTAPVADVAADIAADAAVDAKAEFTAALRKELLGFLESNERLTFPEVEAPEISVLIVVWNHAHLTLRCLRMLRDHRGPTLEIVIVDNDSSDETGLLLSRLDGVRILRSEWNCGFLLGCNQGAALARGRTLLLLNSDAFVRPGALNAALATLDSAPDIGAVGGRLILPTGQLQEAGSIIWSDASTLGYGRGKNPDAGEAMFRHGVDYCSGAFLITPRSLWERLDGFDAAYAPAYYEEADYCMRLRAAGYRVLYEPAAVVDHYEFGSEAKRGDAEKVSRHNRKLFRARHAHALQKDHYPPSEGNILPARVAKMPIRSRLLVIDNDVPFGALGGGYPRAREMLADAVEIGWLVTLYPLHRLEIDWDAARAEIPWEVEIVANRGAPLLAEFLQERRGYYDVVLVSRPENMAFVRNVLRSYPGVLDGARFIYDAEALVATRTTAMAAFEGRPYTEAEAAALIAAEIELTNDVDAIICVTEAEAEVFRNQAVSVHVLSHSVECVADAPGFEGRAGFLFVGRLLEKNVPNWRGLTWFLRECWPLIRASLGDATLSIVGHLHPDHAELNVPGVRLCGPVADLRPLYDSARVFLAPVHFAAGVPIKILEAAAAGLPVIGTQLMARQLSWRSGIEMAAEDDAGAFAAAAVALHEDASGWEAMRVAAMARVRREHSASLFLDRMRALLDGVPSLRPVAFDGEPPVEPDGEYRVSRVEEVWGRAPPREVADQWATYPLSHPAIRADMNRRVTGDAGRDAYDRLYAQLLDWGTPLPIQRAVSLCCGAGALERGLKRSGLISSCVGYDLAAGALAAAREAAAAEGMGDLRYELRDLERDGLGESGLDLVLAHQGIHHLSRLEAVFDAVHDALRPGGIFHLHEFVGPDRFQWNDRQLEEMNRWLASLPERYRRTREGLIKNHVGRATIEEMIAHDPTEAVRSSAIEALVAERFEIVERCALGGTLTMMALAEIAQNFDPSSPEDMSHLDRLLTREDELMASGALGSDFVVLVARRNESTREKSR